MIADLAWEEMCATYRALGLASEGAQSVDWDGVEVICGELPHAISNFAMARHVSPGMAQRLVQQTLRRPSFVVYLFADTDDPSHTALQSAGFERVSTLAVMALEGAPPPPRTRLPEVHPERAESPAAERDIARFMMRVFFPRHRDEVREVVSKVTAGAKLDLYQIRGARQAPVAAVMLARRPSVIGLYNLCVEPALRGKGLGAAIVYWVISQAHGLPVTLQSDVLLQNWYEKLGFVRVGTVGVYGVRS